MAESQPSTEESAEEVAALRNRLLELESALAEHERSEQALRKTVKDHRFLEPFPLCWLTRPVVVNSAMRIPRGSPVGKTI